jgi:hypothetical protein
MTFGRDGAVARALLRRDEQKGIMFLFKGIVGFVWVFSELIVCLDCGTTEFTVPKSELRQLAKGDAAAAG